jgi:prevent-host-death family protein
MTHMNTVGIRELQQNAGAVVARAAAGETIVVTDRGRPVARLVPELGRGLDALRAAGRIRPATRSFDDLPPRIRLTPGEPTISEILEAQRAEDD